MASYINNTLIEGEVVQYEAKISIWSMMHLIIIGILTLIFVIGVFFLLYAWIKYATTELGITNKRIIAKFGFISRHTIELDIHKVESIQVNQTIIGRILNFGDLVISGAGNPMAPIPGIENPLYFRKRYFEVKDKAK